jgi:hypothetical protein
LTGESGSEDIHFAAPWATVEGGNVRADKSLIQGLVFHPRHESGRCIGVPLDVQNGSAVGHGELDSEVEPSDAGKQ